MKTALVKVAIALLVLSSSISGQVTGDAFNLSLYLPFEFGGGGARAEGLGNAYIAVSDGIYAGSWNPAGLITHEAPMLSLGYNSLLGRGATDASVAGLAYNSDHSGNLSGLNDLCFVAPFRLKGHPFVGSLSYTNNFDGLSEIDYMMGLTVPQLVIRQNIWQIQYFTFPTQMEMDYSGGLRSVNIAFGTRVYEDISLGFAANIYDGLTIRDWNYEGYIVDTFPLPPYEQNSTAGFTLQNLDSTQFSGFNVNLGLRYTGNRMNAGLLVRMPFDLEANTGTSAYTVNYVNSLPIAEGTDTTYIDDQLIKYGMPLMVGAGISYKLKENLMLAFDAEYKGYGSSKIKQREELVITAGGNIEETFSEYDPGWKSGVTLRLGGEYMHETSFGIVPLRTGASCVATPAPYVDSEYEGTPGINFAPHHLLLRPLASLLNSDDTPMLYTASLGSGIHWEQIHLDVAYTYSKLDRDWRTNVPEGQSEYNVIKSRDHKISATFTGYF